VRWETLICSITDCIVRILFLLISVVNLSFIIVYRQKQNTFFCLKYVCPSVNNCPELVTNTSLNSYCFHRNGQSKGNTRFRVCMWLDNFSDFVTKAPSVLNRWMCIWWRATLTHVLTLQLHHRLCVYVFYFVGRSDTCSPEASCYADCTLYKTVSL